MINAINQQTKNIFNNQNQHISICFTSEPKAQHIKHRKGNHKKIHKSTNQYRRTNYKKMLEHIKHHEVL